MSSIVLLNICLECPHHLRHLCHLSSHRQHFGNARRGLPRLRRGLLVLQKKRVQDLLTLLRLLRRRLLLLHDLQLLHLEEVGREAIVAAASHHLFLRRRLQTTVRLEGNLAVIIGRKPFQEVRTKGEST